MDSITMEGEGKGMTAQELLAGLLICDDLNYKVFIDGEEVTGCKVVKWNVDDVKFNGGPLTNRVELTTYKEEDDDGEIA
jgi:hypothetical protein